MGRVFTPPEQIVLNAKNSKVFLAGTIDMGESEDWQNGIINHYKNSSIDFYNPRREKWDNSIKQSFDSPEFFQQVSWELDAMDKADIIIMNFLPDSKSPITLLELGLHAKSRKLLVCCPDEFYRSGNVQMVCNAYNIPLFKTMLELTKEFNHNYIKYV